MYTSCTQIKDCGTCTSTPIPNSDASQNCSWNPKTKDCGSFSGGDYGSSCTSDQSYLNTLSDTNSVLKYAGKNIRTTDGTIAYVSQNGLVKGYPDNDIWTATNGSNGCPKIVENVNMLWSTASFPKGTAMASGQACGNETKYVTPSPPENDFDATWYRKTYPSLNLQTDGDALNDWNTSGQQAGRLPNPGILTSMANLGRVGYVDPDAVLHRITNFTAAGYKLYSKVSNVTGANMQDCSASSSVKYGDRIVLAFDDDTAYMTTNSVTKFGSKQVAMIIRPAPNSSDNGSPVKFGDSFSLALSVTNYSSSCGYWGCKVGTLDPKSLTFVFGPGGSVGGTQLQIQLPTTTTSYRIGDSVPYDAPFTLVSETISPNFALFQSQQMTPGGPRIPSANGNYYLTFQTDGYVAFYKSPNTLVWKSEKTDPNPATLSLTDTGSLEAINTDGVTYWTTNTSGAAPFALAVQNDGRLVLYDGAVNEMWSKGTSISPTVDDSKQTIYACVKKSTLTFDPMVTNAVNFSFQTKNGKPPPDKCDVDSLRRACGSDCVGFIHDSDSNEWQQLKASSKVVDFKIGTSQNDVYLKMPNVKLGDSSCAQGQAAYIDPTTFAAYVTGSDLDTAGSNQCAKPVNSKLDDESSKFDQSQKDQLDKATDLATLFDSSRLIDMWNQFINNDDAIQQKANELRASAQKLKKSPGNVTYEKQKEDSEVVERQWKSRSMIWVAVAIAVVGAVLLMWFGFGKVAVYGFAGTAFCYIFYRFFKS